MKFKHFLYRICGIGTLAVALSFSPSTVEAQNMDDCSQWNPCCFPYGLNPPPTCPTCDCCQWAGFIEYLYWKPVVENLHAANMEQVNTFVDAFPRNVTSEKFRVQHKDFKNEWDNGFRVGIGYGFPCDKWGLSLTYTHYRNENCVDYRGCGQIDSELVVSSNIPTAPFLTGVPFDILAYSSFGKLASSWELEFNQIDLDFFRTFYVGCSVQMRPYAGLRILLLENHANYVGSYNTIPELDILNFAEGYSLDNKLRSDFKSIGLKGGMETRYEMFCNLSIYGDLGFAAVYANVKTENKARLTQVIGSSGVGDGTFTENYSAPYEFKAIRFMSDLALGLHWQQLTCCNTSLVVIRIGWEHHYYFNASNFETINKNVYSFFGDPLQGNITSQRACGDMAFYGLNFSIGYWF